MGSERQHWRAPEQRNPPEDDPEIAPKPASDEDERWRPHRPSETPVRREPRPEPAEAETAGTTHWRPPEQRRRPAPDPVASEPAPATHTTGERWQAPPKDVVPLEQSFVAERAAQRRAAVWVDRSERPVPILDPIVATEGLTRDYPMGETIVHALKPVQFQIGRGALVAVHGRSGSGKTTMLNLIGALDRPSAGRVWIDGEEVTALPERALVGLRRYKIGFIFQTFGLIPILTAAENVEVPLRLAQVDVAERDERVRVLLELVGLGNERDTDHTSFPVVSSSASPSRGRSPTARAS